MAGKGVVASELGPERPGGSAFPKIRLRRPKAKRRDVVWTLAARKSGSRVLAPAFRRVRTPHLTTGLAAVWCRDGVSAKEMVVAHIQWSADLAIGHSEIDGQHKQLVRKIDGLLEAMHAGKGKEEVANTLAFLEEYVVFHFGTEEKLMASSHFPGAATHKHQHAELIRVLGGWKKRLEGGATLAVTLELKDALANWLRDHISGSDRALGNFLHDARGRDKRS